MLVFHATLLSYVRCRSTSCSRAKPVLTCRMGPSRWWNADDGVRDGRSNALRIIWLFALCILSRCSLSSVKFSPAEKCTAVRDVPRMKDEARMLPV